MTHNQLAYILNGFATRKVISLRGNEIPNIIMQLPGYQNLPPEELHLLTHDIAGKTPEETRDIAKTIIRIRNTA